MLFFIVAQLTSEKQHELVANLTAREYILAWSRTETDMYKNRMIMTVMIIVSFMTACAQKPNSEERGGIRVDVGDNEYQESQRMEEGAGSLSDDANPALGGGPVPDSSSTENGFTENESIENDSAESSNNFSDSEASEILAACAGTRMEQTIETAGGTPLLISADINVEGITRVSRYEYILTNITEEKRANLFQSVFPETADEAEYDELNDVWTLDIDPAIRNYFLYLISYSNGGATIPGEQIIVFENRYYDLYPFEDNRLDSVSDNRVNAFLDEAESACRRVVDSITDTGDYALDFIHAYGNNGRRPYLKLVFKRMLDGMPVTTYNDLAFLFDNDGIEKVSGSLFSVKETGLDKKILSPEEAVGKLQEQAAFLNFEGASQMEVTEITLEYVVVISSDGKILVTPVWRFLLGEDEDERNFLRQKILGIDAVTGELIWEERGNTL